MNQWVIVFIVFAIFFWFMDIKNDKEFSEYANECNALKHEDNDFQGFVDFGCGGKADWDSY